MILRPVYFRPAFALSSEPYSANMDAFLSGKEEVCTGGLERWKHRPIAGSPGAVVSQLYFYHRILFSFPLDSQPPYPRRFSTKPGA